MPPEDEAAASVNRIVDETCECAPDGRCEHNGTPALGMVDVDSLAIEGLTEKERQDFLDSPDVQPHETSDEEMYVRIAAAIDPVDPHDSAKHPTFRAAVDAARRAERALIADELLAWAWETDEPMKRQLRAASLRIAPEATEDEMRQGLVGLLAGMKGRNHA